MSATFRYDPRFDPPAPVVAVAVSAPGAAAWRVVVPALIDSGADCTVLPESVVAAARLPQVGWLHLAGFGSSAIRVPRHLAFLQVGRRAASAQVGACGEEALLGRDWLNHWRVELDGPGLTLRLTDPPRRRMRQRR